MARDIRLSQAELNHIKTITGDQFEKYTSTEVVNLFKSHENIAESILEAFTRHSRTIDFLLDNEIYTIDGFKKGIDDISKLLSAIPEDDLARLLKSQSHQKNLSYKSMLALYHFELMDSQVVRSHCVHSGVFFEDPVLTYSFSQHVQSMKSKRLKRALLKKLRDPIYFSIALQLYYETGNFEDFDYPHLHESDFIYEIFKRNNPEIEPRLLLKLWLEAGAEKQQLIASSEPLRLLFLNAKYSAADMKRLLSLSLPELTSLNSDCFTPGLLTPERPMEYIVIHRNELQEIKEKIKTVNEDDRLLSSTAKKICDTTNLNYFEVIRLFFYSGLKIDELSDYFINRRFDLFSSEIMISRFQWSKVGLNKLTLHDSDHFEWVDFYASVIDQKGPDFEPWLEEYLRSPFDEQGTLFDKVVSQGEASIISTWYQLGVKTPRPILEHTDPMATAVTKFAWLTYSVKKVRRQLNSWWVNIDKVKELITTIKQTQQILANITESMTFPEREQLVDSLAQDIKHVMSKAAKYSSLKKECNDLQKTLYTLTYGFSSLPEEDAGDRSVTATQDGFTAQQASIGTQLPTSDMIDFQFGTTAEADINDFKTTPTSDELERPVGENQAERKVEDFELIFKRVNQAFSDRNNLKDFIFDTNTETDCEFAIHCLTNSLKDVRDCFAALDESTSDKKHVKFFEKLLITQTFALLHHMIALDNIKQTATESQEVSVEMISDFLFRSDDFRASVKMCFHHMKDNPFKGEVFNLDNPSHLSFIAGAYLREARLSKVDHLPELAFNAKQIPTLIHIKMAELKSSGKRFTIKRLIKAVESDESFFKLMAQYYENLPEAVRSSEIFDLMNESHILAVLSAYNEAMSQVQVTNHGFPEITGEASSSVISATPRKRSYNPSRLHSGHHHESKVQESFSVDNPLREHADPDRNPAGSGQVRGRKIT